MRKMLTYLIGASFNTKLTKLVDYINKKRRKNEKD